MAKRKREICDRCLKPTPQACICSALPEPSELINLLSSRVLVLQHPHEAKRKNRSLPLISLCMSTSSNSGETFDFNFETIVTKRLGDQIAQSHPKIIEFLHDPSNPVFLCYPSDDAISVQEAMERVKSQSKREGENQHEQHYAIDNDLTQTENAVPMNVVRKKYTIIFIDATWKYAKEMDSKSIENKSWPKHMIRIKLNPEKGECGENFQPRRFDIRTPPSINHLSTAECIAHVIRIVEAGLGSKLGPERKDDILFQTLMKPLDLMVKTWRSFSDKRK